LEENTDTKKVSIIIPLYKNEALVNRLITSLLNTQKDWALLTSRLIFINDSPDDLGLEAALNNFDWKQFEVECIVVSNPKNLGFVKSANLGLKMAREVEDHALLLNSDTVVFGNWLSGLVSVMFSDEKIAFVNPRSNNATIATYPQMSDDYVGLTPEAAYGKFLERSNGLPAFSFVPLTVGFCMLIRSWIIKDLGLLDEAYGFGYNEENDYVMRANRFGMVAALANLVFVYHEGEASFSIAPVGKEKLEAKNQLVFNKRYPESKQALERYYSGPRFSTELIWSRTGGEKPKITFDLTNLHSFENGTAKLSRSLVDWFRCLFGQKYEVVIYASAGTIRFHGLIHKDLTFVDSSKAEIPFSDAIIRVGQIFTVDWVLKLRRKTRVLSVLMLDPIAWDTQATAADFDPKSWTSTFVLANQIPSISRFAQNSFDKRFPYSGKAKPLNLPPSLARDDYLYTKKAVATQEKYILVLGNKFRHKFVPETVLALSELSEYRIYAIGGPNPIPNAFRQYVSGEIPSGELEDLILGAEAIVFPSVYEGFGFPVIEALANGKKVFARELEVNREISAALGHPEHLRLYDNTENLVREISNLSCLATSTSEIGGQDHSWSQSVMHLEKAIATELSESSFSALEDTLTLTWLIEAKNHLGDPITRLMSRIERAIRSALTNPVVFLAAKRVWDSIQEVKQRPSRTRN
jgi:GT2 family glycosyltransferase